MNEVALVIGGTRFIGRHTVSELQANGYEVAIFNRGHHDNPFGEDVTHVQGDRAEKRDIRAAKLSVDPDIVIDCIAYQPRDVQVATEVFADVDAYLYVSSGGAYSREEIPKREAETPIKNCTAEQATDPSDETYGNRKAEGDRAVFQAASDGVNAMSVRPSIVYGPHDYTERLDYWIDRVATHDEIVVPGDGQNIWHRAYVEDVASALRIVAEEGTPGETYNVGDQRIVTLEEMVGVIAHALETDCAVKTAGEDALAVAELRTTDFILYREYPHVLDTAKLAALGWESTSLTEAMNRTVTEHVESDRDGSEHDPGRDAEERVLGVLDTL